MPLRSGGLFHPTWESWTPAGGRCFNALEVGRVISPNRRDHGLGRANGFNALEVGRVISQGMFERWRGGNAASMPLRSGGLFHPPASSCSRSPRTSFNALEVGRVISLGVVVGGHVVRHASMPLRSGGLFHRKRPAPGRPRRPRFNALEVGRVISQPDALGRPRGPAAASMPLRSGGLFHHQPDERVIVYDLASMPLRSGGLFHSESGTTATAAPALQCP